MPTTLVRDLMQVGVPTCREDTALPDVARLLVERNAGALVVLDEDGNRIVDDDLPLISNAYARFREENDVRF